MAVLKPFQDDGTSIGIGGFTIENGTDRIAVYGQTDITRDQAGLRVARELARFLDQVIVTLAAEKSLPDQTPGSAKRP
jgi:hypothetical protein